MPTTRSASKRFDVPEKDEHPEEAQHIGIGIGAGGRSKSFASKSLGEGEKTGVQITIHNLTYRVPLGKGQERYLLGGLEPLTGTMDPGQMVALMTPGMAITRDQSERSAGDG